MTRTLGGRVVEVDPENHPAFSVCSLDECDTHARSLRFSYGGKGYCSRECCAEAMDRVGDREGVRALYSDEEDSA